MKERVPFKNLLPVIFFLLQVSAFTQTATETYPIDPASVEQQNVPKGEVLKFTFENSKIYPGTWREYWIYLPRQYNP